MRCKEIAGSEEQQCEVLEESRRSTSLRSISKSIYTFVASEMQLRLP